MPALNEYGGGAARWVGDGEAGDFLSKTTDDKVHRARSDLVSLRSADAAVGNLSVASRSREVHDHQAGQ